MIKGTSAPINKMTADDYGRLLRSEITVNMLPMRSNGTIYGEGQKILISGDGYVAISKASGVRKQTGHCQRHSFMQASFITHIRSGGLYSILMLSVNTKQKTM